MEKRRIGASAYARLLLISTILLTTGCENKFGQRQLSGKWQGYVTERGQSTLVQLNLHANLWSTKGTLSVLSQTGEDIDRGMSFAITQVKRSGKRLEFLVPLSGKLDDDTLAFDLYLEQGFLKGFMRELRQGSQLCAIIFTKQQ